MHIPFVKKKRIREGSKEEKEKKSNSNREKGIEKRGYEQKKIKYSSSPGGKRSVLDRDRIHQAPVIMKRDAYMQAISRAWQIIEDGNIQLHEYAVPITLLVNCRA